MGNPYPSPANGEEVSKSLTTGLLNIDSTILGFAVVNKYEKIRFKCDLGMPPPSSDILIAYDILF